jgi:hypothetical protein
VPHDEAVDLLPEQTRQTESWAKRGFWVTTRPSVELTTALTRYEDNFDTLGIQGPFAGGIRKLTTHRSFGGMAILWLTRSIQHSDVASYCMEP